jgi:hypothetical protein
MSVRQFLIRRRSTRNVIQAAVACLTQIKVLNFHSFIIFQDELPDGADQMHKNASTACCKQNGNDYGVLGYVRHAYDGAQSYARQLQAIYVLLAQISASRKIKRTVARSFES